MKTAILIMAAGTSSRMGSPKQLLSYNSTTILGNAIHQALASMADDVYVVLGAEAETIKKHIDNTVRIIVNSDYKKGLGSSIKKGISHLKHYDAILIALADQPKIKTDYYNAMISLLKKHPNHIIVSEYKSHKGVPALFPKKSYSYLTQIQDDQGAKQLLNSHLILTKSVNFSVNLLDIDTPEDYKALIKNNN